MTAGTDRTDIPPENPLVPVSRAPNEEGRRPPARRGLFAAAHESTRRGRRDRPGLRRRRHRSRVALARSCPPTRGTTSGPPWSSRARTGFRSASRATASSSRRSPRPCCSATPRPPTTSGPSSRPGCWRRCSTSSVAASSGRWPEGSRWRSPSRSHRVRPTSPADTPTSCPCAHPAQRRVLRPLGPRPGLRADARPWCGCSRPGSSSGGGSRCARPPCSRGRSCSPSSGGGGPLLRTYAIVAAPVLRGRSSTSASAGWSTATPCSRRTPSWAPTPQASGEHPPPHLSRSTRPTAPAGATSWPSRRRRCSDLTVRGWSSAAPSRCLAVLVPDRGCACCRPASSPSSASTSSPGACSFPDRPLGTLNNPRYWIQYFPFIALVLAGLVSAVARWVVARRAITSLARSGGRRGARRGRRVRRPGVAHRALHDGDLRVRPERWRRIEELRSHLGGSGFAVDEVWTDWHDQADRAGVPATGPRWRQGVDRAAGGASPARGGRGPGMPCCSTAPAAASATTAAARSRRGSEQHPVLPDTWELVFEDSEGVVQLYLVH